MNDKYEPTDSRNSEHPKEDNFLKMIPDYYSQITKIQR